MDAVPCSWNAAQAQESFTRARPMADTLTKLAKLMARADHKQDARSPRLPPLLAASLFACAECGQGFTDKAELRHHQQGEHPLPKPHQCVACGKGFSLLSSLQLHQCLDFRDDDDAPPCELCGGEKTPSGAPPCPACAAVPSDPESPGDKSPPHHQGLRHDGSPYACAPCGRSFSQKQALLHHQQSGCSEPEDPDNVDDSPPPDSPSSEPSSRGAVVCPHCGRTFRSPAGLACHRRSVHPKAFLLEKNTKANGSNTKKKQHLACRSCDLVFPNTAKLYLHRTEKHSREKDARPLGNKRRKGETYPCQVCGMVFLHHLSLLHHAKKHNVQSQCQAAEKKQKKPKGNLLGGHMRPGRPKKERRQLEEEGELKPKANMLGGHMRRGRPKKDRRRLEEEEEGEFPCTSCEEVFPLQSALREHAELHQPSGVRRTQCSVCSQHMDVSKGHRAKRQRLYHCGPCQQAFTSLEIFLQHCQVHLLARVEDEEEEGGVDSGSVACDNKV